MICPCCHTDLEAYMRSEAREAVRKESYLLSYEHAAEALDCTTWKIEELVDAGELDIVTLGPRTFRIPREELERYVREHQGGKTWQERPKVRKATKSQGEPVQPITLAPSMRGRTAAGKRQ